MLIYRLVILDFKNLTLYMWRRCSHFAVPIGKYRNGEHSKSVEHFETQTTFRISYIESDRLK